MVLNLVTKKSITDVLSSSGEVDGDLLEDVMQTHSSGVRVLLAPPRPEMAELVTIEFLKKVLIRLRATYDYVVVDTWNSFHDQVLAVLDLSDRILLLMTSEIPTIKNVKLFLEVAEALGYPPDKIVLVLNRSDSRGGISMQDIQRSINHSIVGGIVSDGTLAISAVNRGIPFVVSHKDSQISRNVRDLGRLLVTGMAADRPSVGQGKANPAAPTKKGFFAKLFG